MHRLFVALRPPPAIRGPLLAVQGGIDHARWQDDEQLHLTLRFVGEVDGAMAEDVAAALSTVRHPPVTLALGGYSVFDRRGRVDTLWIGAGPAAPLAALHRKVDQALVRAGLPPERRAFVPHITLARFGARAGALDGFLARPAPAPDPVVIDAFMLYESTLGGEGARYAAVARYPLAG